MKKYYYVFKANLMKEFIESKRYFANTIVTLIVLYVIFLVMFLGIKIGWEKEVSSDNLNYLIISFLIWYTSSLIIQSLAISISRETMKGTIEQLFLSRIRIDFVIMFKMISIILVNFISVMALLFLVMLSTNQWVNIFSLRIFILYILAIFSMFGISFVLSGLAIYYKQIDGFMQIAMMIFLAISFASTKLTPMLSLLPFVKAIDLIKLISANSGQVTTIPFTDYVIVITNSLIYFAVGYFAFHYFVNKAIDKGILGSY